MYDRLLRTPPEQERRTADTPDAPRSERRLPALHAANDFAPQNRLRQSFGTEARIPMNSPI